MIFLKRLCFVLALFILCYIPLRPIWIYRLFYDSVGCFSFQSETKETATLFSLLQNRLASKNYYLFKETICPKNIDFIITDQPNIVDKHPRIYLILTEYKDSIIPSDYKAVFATKPVYQQLKKNQHIFNIQSEKLVHRLASIISDTILYQDILNTHFEINIRTHVGIGNQMFMYAGAKAYALRFNKKAYLKTEQSALQKAFDLPENTIKGTLFESLHQTSSCLLFSPEFSSAQFCKDCLTHSNFGSNNGFLQSFRNFSDYLPEILSSFRFKPFDDDRNKNLARKLRHQNSVSIHIRRGDYIYNKYPLLFDSLYYQRAVDYIKQHVKNPHFYVFTNDTKWVKQYFDIGVPFTVIDWNNTSENNYRDMQLMSLCKHNIIANSTFSYWAAMLNKNPQKIVIYPDVWLSWDKKWINEMRVPGWIEIKSGITINSKGKLKYPFIQSYVAPK